MPFTRGDIVLPSNRVARKNWLNGLYHPAVVWNDIYEGGSDFSGIMLTHSGPSHRFENILMAANHFEVGYKVNFYNTHFVNQVFVKFYSWGPFDVIGKLTIDGISFIESKLNPNSYPLEFVEYLKR
jgi:hypothetical protein